MVWQAEVDEISRRVELAKRMGGEVGIDVQHGRGKLTVRERIELLTDKGSFQEIGRLAGAATYDGDTLVDVRPSNMLIGLCALNGRKVVLNGSDFTVANSQRDFSKRDYSELCFNVKAPDPSDHRSSAPRSRSRSKWLLIMISTSTDST